jgi:hypothetical protein
VDYLTAGRLQPRPDQTTPPLFTSPVTLRTVPGACGAGEAKGSSSGADAKEPESHASDGEPCTGRPMSESTLTHLSLTDSDHRRMPGLANSRNAQRTAQLQPFFGKSGSQTPTNSEVGEVREVRHPPIPEVRHPPIPRKSDTGSQTPTNSPPIPRSGKSGKSDTHQFPGRGSQESQGSQEVRHPPLTDRSGYEITICVAGVVVGSNHLLHRH